MQGYYMYGIVESQRDFPPDIPGLDGKPVYLIPWRNLAAMVSDAPLRGYAADGANATRHGAIVEETMQGGPILPMRFGTVLGERQRVVTMLEEHSGAFEEALRRLRGRVEMGLRVLWEPPGESEVPADQEIEGRGPGTEYLSRRLKDEWRRAKLLQAGERLIQELDAPLRSLAIESRLQRFPTNRFLIAGAYLVERHRVDAFREGVMKARERFPRLRFLLTGPWPPYHFVNGAHDGTVPAFAA